ncbi:Thioredoxin, partial [Leucoagaricus sp. SymC.cos]
KPIVVDFWAEWCGPCRLISPTYESIAKKAGANVGFYKVDVDTQSEISEEVGIRAMPTFIVFRKGEKKHELVGASPPRLEVSLICVKI